MNLLLRLAWAGVKALAMEFGFGECDVGMDYGKAGN